MCREIRPELSKKNKYWISKDRYYELKHFCLQYNEFKKLREDIIAGSIPTASMKETYSNKYDFTDPVFDTVVALDRINYYIRVIEECANKVGDLDKYILMGVTKGVSCNTLITKHEMPASPDMYYDRYRKFFYILHKKLLFESY